MTRHSYGWKRDYADSRDRRYAGIRRPRAVLPSHVDLRDKCSPVYDQGSLGSCTGNAVCGAHEYNQIAQLGIADFVPVSRLQNYYDAREIEGTIKQDSGAMIRDNIRAAVNNGICAEKLWPYDVKRFADRPAMACYRDAKKRQVTAYYRLEQSLEELRTCLAEGFPFLFGFTVYPSFETKKVTKTGIATMPTRWDKLRGALGGHAILAVGYDDYTQRVLFRNSWGVGWGQKGYGELPYGYFRDPKLSSDYWTIRMVEESV